MLRRVAIGCRSITLQPTVNITRRYTTSSAAAQSRIRRIESRLPRFLQRIVNPIRNAPVSHITAFIILHELTAIVPLFGIAAVFHYSNWLPPYISEGKWVHEYQKKFGNWLRKRRWIKEDNRSGRWWGRSEGGVRIVIELATAYAITKALLPLRLLLSVWATPWFARWTTLPFINVLRRIFLRSKGSTPTTSPVAGTNAIGGRVLPKEAMTRVR